MSEQIDSCFADLTADFLVPIVSQALGVTTCAIQDFQAQPIQRSYATPSQVMRVTGTALCDQHPSAWSLFMKRIANQESDNPSAAGYWKRELYGYKSGFLERLPGGITAPRCYCITRRPNGDFCLWLEDLRDDFDGQWPLERFATTACHFGRFNGAYLSGRTVPRNSWIAQNWLRKMLEEYAPAVAFARANPRHPAVRALLPANSAGSFLRLWDARGELLDILDRMPQTFCHQFATRDHLYARGEETVLIDWEYMGFAPLGSDMVCLVAANVALQPGLASQARRLDAAAFTAYYAGLREMGILADVKSIRLAYVISTVLRFSVTILGQGLPQLIEGEEEGLPERVTRLRLPFADRQREIARYWLGLGSELLRRLGLARSARIFIFGRARQAA